MGKNLIIKGADFSQNAIVSNLTLRVILNKVIDYPMERLRLATSDVKRALLYFDIPNNFDLSKKLIISTNLTLLNSGTWFFNETFSFTENTIVTPYIINKPINSNWVDNFPIETNILSSYPNLKRITMNLAPNPSTALTFYTEEELLNGITITKI